MFARFDENPAMTLRVIKETKHYRRTHARMDGQRELLRKQSVMDGRMDARTDGQRENSIPPTNNIYAFL